MLKNLLESMRTQPSPNVNILERNRDFERQVSENKLRIPNKTASKWLTLCNFTNIKQKIDYMREYDNVDHRDSRQL